MLKILSVIILTAASMTASAQNKVDGIITGGGGLGAAAPYQARVSLNIKAPRFILQPYFGVQGISRNSSGEDENIYYTYTGKAPLSTSSDRQYSSKTHTESEGYALNYGVSATYIFNKNNALTASLKGDAMKKNNYGCQEETDAVKEPMLYPVAPVLSTLSGSSHSHNISIAAGYQYRKDNGFDGFNFDYSYSRESQDADTDQQLYQGWAYTRFKTSLLNTDGVTQKHRLQGAWQQLIQKTRLSLGAFYEDREIKSNDRQTFDDLSVLQSFNERFCHRYQTVGTFVAAGSKIGDVAFNARLEYDYTDMRNKHLNDLLPSASVEWSMTKANTLSARYVRRLVRPTLEYLNPAKIQGTYTTYFGNPDMEGIHANSVAMAFRHRGATATFSTSLEHIFVQDGFNAICMEKDGVRITTWGNEGVRRAWSLTPELLWNVSAQTQINAKANAIWDKRIAYAINMAYEHWGMTLQAGLQQKLPYGISLDLNARYSEGNTLNLYSHEGRNYELAAKLKRSFLKDDRLTLALDYAYREQPHTVVKQGAYIGTDYRRLSNRNTASLRLSYRF